MSSAAGPRGVRPGEGARRDPRPLRPTRFGQSCLLARRLIERGVRFVTVNMFETVFDEITWDIHGSPPFTDIEQMSRASSRRTSTRPTRALLEDLSERGLLSNTMVRGDGRVRPDAEDQPGRRPRPPPRRAGRS